MNLLYRFLANATLESIENQADIDINQYDYDILCKTFSDIVFVTGLEEGLFPHENSLNEIDGLEEERRLMYVAITRAKKRLFLSSAQARRLHGQIRYHKRSRFINEIPEECIKHHSLGNNVNIHSVSKENIGFYNSNQIFFPISRNAPNTQLCKHCSFS